MRLCVFEFGLRNRTGHHYNSARSILAAAEAAGVEVRILAGDTLTTDPEFAGRARPFFRTDLYTRAREFAGSENFDSWQVVGDRLSRDLERIPAPVLADADVVLVPAVSPFHIWALCDWASRTLLVQFEAALVIHFMFQPIWSSWGRVCAPGPQMYRDALALVGESVERRIFLTAELDASAREFERVLQKPVHVLPHPAVQADRSQIDPRDRAAEPALIGVFGNSKREKGFHLVPEIVTLTAARLQNRGLRFVVQVDHSGADPAIAEAEAALVQIGEPLVEIFSGGLSVEDYWTALERIDLFLLPYDPILYGSRGSGLLSEAASLGAPVVGPDGTGIGAEVAASRAAGVLFDRYEPDDIAKATVDAIERLPQLRKAAQSIAVDRRNSNSGLGYLEKLRALTGR